MVTEFSYEMITDEPNVIETLIEKWSGWFKQDQKKIILFGAGNISLLYLDFFKKHNLEGRIMFGDNNPQKSGTQFEGLPVLGLKEISTRYPDCHILITSLRYFEEIYNSLKENGLCGNLVDKKAHEWIVKDLGYYCNWRGYSKTLKEAEAKLKEVYGFLSDDESRAIFIERFNYCITANPKYLIPKKSSSPQYFEPDLFTLTDEEVFVDGGAYTGDTVEEFLTKTNHQFSEIHSFEPEDSKIEEYNHKFANVQRIHLHPFGLWNKKEVLRFNSNNAGDSGISNEGNIEIPVISLDEVLEGKRVTFIKMDIEGAELEALRGAEKTIKKSNPKLAICVYHKPLDLVDIPLYIKELVPEYNIYLRHYGDDLYETVCYAIPKD
jgi:FkbM family methyltransferase